MRGIALVLVLSGCRSILGIDDGKPKVDASGAGSDGAGSGSDAGTCYGTLLTVCLQAPPTSSLTISDPINTDTDAHCISATNGVDACVFAGASIVVNTGATVTVRGSRPLVLVATGSITVDGVLDVASHGVTAGAAGNSTECQPGTLPASSAGGAGGTFGTRGGGGGASSLGNGGGAAPLAQGVPGHLRGGCAGQNGSGNGGEGGAGGGAIALIAVGELKIAGSVDASGGGGRGGAIAATGAGGGGGGSGGMIILDAGSLASSLGATVYANGGGGGEGSGPTNAGNAGLDPSSLQPATGGANGASGGGDGGNGFGSAMPAQAGATGSGNNGGGGAGGGGAGVIRSTSVITSLFSPQPT